MKKIALTLVAFLGLFVFSSCTTEKCEEDTLTTTSDMLSGVKSFNQTGRYAFIDLYVYANEPLSKWNIEEIKIDYFTLLYRDTESENNNTMVFSSNISTPLFHEEQKIENPDASNKGFVSSRRVILKTFTDTIPVFLLGINGDMSYFHTVYAQVSYKVNGKSYKTQPPINDFLGKSN